MLKRYLWLVLWWVCPLVACAQKHTIPPPGMVIDKSANPQHVFFGSPSIAILPNGNYVASHDYFGGGTNNDSTTIFTSADRGATWERIAELQGQYWSTLFVHNGHLYILGNSKLYGNIVIRRSDDGGRTWTTPMDGEHGLIRKGTFHCGPVPVVVYGGRIWRAMEQVQGTNWPFNFHAMVISAPDSVDLLKARNWSVTNTLTFDTSWMNAARPGWLEGNVVVTPDGKMREIMRLNGSRSRRDTYKQTGYVKGLPRYETAAMLDISSDGKRLSFDPAEGFFHFPGAESKFTIRYDSASNRYWAIVNKITNLHAGTGAYSPQCQRNVLMLTSSKDLKRWKENYLIVRYREGARLNWNDKAGFQYVDWQFNGKDIVAVIRTAWGNSSNYHNANYLTFHRIEDFRHLKMKDSPKDLYVNRENK